ncbi:MAG TPA: type II toxin-antitoxin system VapC family toxin, partial [Burkholderiaceae bacterium]|nr:type II toxin-antitoxin system VapC family toxin [Burkholderiaceae bacterium]
MAALDTNVLVRFLVEDDRAQLAAARRLFEDCAARNEPLFVPKAVVLELEWVLRKLYEVSKADFIQGLSQLLSTTELMFEDEAAIEEALDQYQMAKADFADCLHLSTARRAGQEPLWT